MPVRKEISLGSGRRALVVASRFNEGITRKLLAGAVDVLEVGGFGGESTDVFWVPGAFEIPVVIHEALSTGEYSVAVAVGAVIRGETPHFEYIARETSRGLASAAVRFGVPVGFGLLTCDTMEQALARSGGAAGNKGEEAAQAALDTLSVLDQLPKRA